MPSWLSIGHTAVNDLGAAKAGGRLSRLLLVSLKVSGANEAGGAKRGASTHHHQAMPGHVQLRSLLVNCPWGDARPCPATALTRLTSEGSLVRSQLRPLFRRSETCRGSPIVSLGN